MFIPSILITLLTFPGVILHEMAHVLVCRLSGVRVVKACYFRLGNPAGYVIYESPESAWHHISICAGPFLVNSIAGAAVGCAARGIITSPRMHYILLWLAVSFAMHAFPSRTDARSIWKGVWSKRAPILAKLVGTPVVAMIYLGSIGSIFWLDLLYGVAVAVYLPKWLLMYALSLGRGLG